MKPAPLALNADRREPETADDWLYQGEIVVIDRA
jgi:hypothetical protein